MQTCTDTWQHLRFLHFSHTRFFVLSFEHNHTNSCGLCLRSPCTLAFAEHPCTLVCACQIWADSDISTMLLSDLCFLQSTVALSLLCCHDSCFVSSCSQFPIFFHILERWLGFFGKLSLLVADLRAHSSIITTSSSASFLRRMSISLRRYHSSSPFAASLPRHPRQFGPTLALQLDHVPYA